jgi:hypothetical protein
MKRYREAHVTCPSCRKRRGRLSGEPYRHGIVRAKCRNCGTDFFRWRGRGWVIPDDNQNLRDALAEAGCLGD